MDSIARGEIKVRVLCLGYILISHLKYPYLELKPPKLEYFLFHDFKYYP